MDSQLAVQPRGPVLAVRGPEEMRQFFDRHLTHYGARVISIASMAMIDDLRDVHPWLVVAIAEGAVGLAEQSDCPQRWPLAFYFGEGRRPAWLHENVFALLLPIPLWNVVRLIGADPARTRSTRS